MKKKLCAIFLCGAIICAIFCAFTFDPSSSVTSLTKPYITTYDCTEARLGEEDLLEKYEYIKIIFIDENEIDVSYKAKNGKRHAHRCAYTYDDETGEFEAEIGILGYKLRQKAKIDGGKFTLNMPILGKPLIISFES